MDFEFKKLGTSFNSGSATGSDRQLEACLSAESFDVKQFVRDVATKYDSMKEWTQHKKKVHNLADRTAQQLKQNVFKNYVLFIDSSKEISSLEAEMYQLNQYLHDQNLLTRSLRNLSIMDTKVAFEEMERVEKQEQQHSISFLLETVEGGSIVTDVPERYLVHSGHFYELDRESHRELGEVRAFLLNDSLMTASPVQKRKGPVKYTFQALYELDNMAIVNIKDTETLKFSFKILMFPDSHLYQAESEEDKHQWIQVLEKTKRKHKEAIDASKREAVQRSRSQSMEASLLSIYSNKAFSKEQAGASENKLADVLMEDWIKEVPENLDVYIEQREFDQSVKLILKTKSFLKSYSDTHAVRDMRARLNHRINRLSEVLMKELEASPSGSLRGGPRAARRAVGYLLQLGRSAKACKLFLENYRQIIERDLDDVKMEDSVHLYITNFASTFFTGLRNAAAEFERAFKEHYGSYSSFIVWCNKLLKFFAEKSAQVVFSSGSKAEDHPLSTITECILSVMKECDGLNNIGLDLSFALWDLYHPYLAQALNEGRKRIREECATSGTAETWIPLDLRNEKDQPKLTAIILQMQSLGMNKFENLIHDRIVDLSSTTINFCMMTIDFMNDVFRIYTSQLLEDFIVCFCDIFHNMGNLYGDALKRDENIAMVDCIMGDCQFVVETLLPTFITKMNKETGVDIPDLVELHDEMHDMFEKTSRAASAEPPSTKPAMPYQDAEDGESEEDEELYRLAADDETHSSDEEQDEIV